MTAEIAILNCEAIALAADSAATFRSEHGQKIFTSANKIFTLSKYHAVGVMIYGGALFHQTPWETIIKIYRKELGRRKFPTLQAQAQHFLQYLKSNRMFSPARSQVQFVRDMVVSYYQFIKKDLLAQTKRILENDTVGEDQVLEITGSVIDRHLGHWKKANKGPHASAGLKAAILRRYKAVISKSMSDVFEELPLSRANKNKLTELACLIFLNRSSDINNPNKSGIVVAGFGDKDIFPNCISYQVLGVAADQLIYFEHERTNIGTKVDATIVPFAQDDVAKLFIEGADTRYTRLIKQELDQILLAYPDTILSAIADELPAAKPKIQRLKVKLQNLAKEKSAEYKSVLDEYRREKYVSPMLSVVSMLPKDELANMAETLVNLTSFKRRVSMSEETVGGPVDVAVISKGDGFVWIKRKHYFNKEFNPSFVANYFNE